MQERGDRHGRPSLYQLPGSPLPMQHLYDKMRSIKLVSSEAMIGLVK